MTFYPQVRRNSGSDTDRADATKAVQLAMQDLDVNTRVSEAGGNKMLKVYGDEATSISMRRRLNRDRDQEKIDAMIAGCPSQACKDTITTQFAVCHTETQNWYSAHQEEIANAFDSSEGKALTSEWRSREAACLAQAKKTLRGALNHVAGEI